MQKSILARVWDDRKSLALTKYLTLAIAAACVALTASGYRIVTWVMHERTLNISGPAVAVALLGIGYVCAALAFVTLYNLYRFLDRLQKGRVFVARNVTALRRISWCCALAGVVCLATGVVIYLPYAFLGVAAGFMALIVRVVKNAFEQAIRMKAELDLTI